MEVEQLTQEHKEEISQPRDNTKHQKKDGGRSNQQSISTMEAMLEDQAHAIADLCADRDAPPFPPLPPPVLQAPRKPLQIPSGFNQRKLLVDKMDACKGGDDQLMGDKSSRY